MDHKQKKKGGFAPSEFARKNSEGGGFPHHNQKKQVDFLYPPESTNGWNPPKIAGSGVDLSTFSFLLGGGYFQYFPGVFVYSRGCMVYQHDFKLPLFLKGDVYENPTPADSHPQPTSPGSLFQPMKL